MGHEYHSWSEIHADELLFFMPANIMALRMVYCLAPLPSPLITRMDDTSWHRSTPHEAATILNWGKHIESICKEILRPIMPLKLISAVRNIQALIKGIW